MIAPAAHVEQLLRLNLNDAGLLEGEPPLLVVAVSGGLDSMTLAWALLSLRRELAAEGPPQTPPPFDLLIAHFDHALRATSAADADFVMQAAARWDLPFVRARWEHGAEAGSGSHEAEARAARYGFLAAVVAQLVERQPGRRVVVLTAHHADDQAETLLLNLLRGTGITGLAAMRSPAPLPGAPHVTLLRPLLRLPRAALHEAALEWGLEWRDDESNTSTVHRRNLLREEVLPLLEAAHPGARARLARTATLLAEEADRLARATEAQLAALTLEFLPDERLHLDGAALAALHPADRRAVLHLALQRLATGGESPGFAGADALARAIGGDTLCAQGPHTLPGGLRWTLLPAADGRPARLSLHRVAVLPADSPGPRLDDEWRTAVGSTPVVPNHSLQIGNWRLYIRLELPDVFPGAHAIPPLEAWFDAAVGPLRLRSPLPGDRIAPLGMGGHYKSLGDLFTDTKIAPALRVGHPLICNEAGEVLWVCGIAVAQSAAVTPASQQLVHLRWLAADDPALAQPRMRPPRANVKPLMHWAIATGSKVRFSRREPRDVEGETRIDSVWTPFHYDPATRILRLSPGADDERLLHLNEYGWVTPAP